MTQWGYVIRRTLGLHKYILLHAFVACLRNIYFRESNANDVNKKNIEDTRYVIYLFMQEYHSYDNDVCIEWIITADVVKCRTCMFIRIKPTSTAWSWVTHKRRNAKIGIAWEGLASKIYELYNLVRK